MTRLALLRFGVVLFAFGAGLLVDGNVGRIIKDGTVVESAQAARRTVRRTTVRHGPRGTTVRRTTVRRGPAYVTPRGVARRTARRTIRRTGVYIAALPRGCIRTTMYGYAVWRCGGVYYQPYGGRYVVVRF
jgi:hypothetical protein